MGGNYHTIKQLVKFLNHHKHLLKAILAGGAKEQRSKGAKVWAMSTGNGGHQEWSFEEEL